MNVPSTSRVRNVANELPRVKSECFALRIKISRGLLRLCALGREKAEATGLLKEGDIREERGEGPKSTEEILIYTIGVLTSLKNGRLIAQSRIIRRFRVTKPRRGGLYQLDVRAIAREKVKKRARGRLRHTGEGQVRGARRIYECTFRIHFGRAICGNGERASEWPCFICEVREELQLCGGTLSFVIRGGDRLSAVVRFGSNMSYVRGEPAASADYPELLSRLGRSVAALTSGDRVVAKEKEIQKRAIIISNEAMPVDRQRERGRKCAKGAERQLGGDRWKKKEETEK
ncbi:hypothetical protein G5I_00667 [Acromyrmex echinatior]|uniref:Uncharacterized protein n=1 Tax=Acromyrmex echinatior TaxID=103372 RepID=F4W5H0_ACREC|nr:hypothetical protein G5I_00667 [Acromyrmex echinatior]